MTSTGAEPTIAERRARAGKNDEYRARRALLLQQAGHLFHKQGLAETSLADIAAAAGLDRASMYYYFSNKEEIIAEVLREVLSRNAEVIRQIAISPLAPDVKLQRMFVAGMQTFDREYPHLFVYVREDLARLPISRELKSWFLRHTNEQNRLWRDVVEEGIHDGTFATELPTDIATAMMLGALASAHRWYRPGGALTPEAAGEGLAKLLIEGLRSRPA